MAAILYLDPDDVIASIKAKIDTADDATIELVAPSGLQALRDPVNLRLLHRYIEQQGMRATLVTRDGTTSQLARAAGLRVRRGSRGSDSRQASAVGRRRDGTLIGYAGRSLGLGVWRALGLIGIVGVLLLPLVGVALFLLPSATITLRPAARQFEEVVEITASTLARGIDLEKLMVPARDLETDVRVSSQLAIQGTQKVPDARARGLVVFTNSTDAPVHVLPNTRVAAGSGVVFLTQTSALVPPDKPEGVQVAVAAVYAGAEGNVDPHTVLQILDQGLEGRVTVVNEQAILGGSDKERQVVREEDHRELREGAFSLAREEASRRLRELNPSDVSFYDESVRLRIATEELYPQVGEDATNVSMRVAGTGSVVGFSEQGVDDLLARYVSEQGADYVLADDGLETRALELVRFDNDSITFRIHVKATLLPRIDEAEVKALLEGKTVGDAEALLAERLPLAGRPQVETAPFWVDTVTSFLWRITIHQVPQIPVE